MISILIFRFREFTLNDGEVEEILLLDQEEINDLVGRKEKITPDSVECFKFLLNQLNEKI